MIRRAGTNRDPALCLATGSALAAPWQRPGSALAAPWQRPGSAFYGADLADWQDALRADAAQVARLIRDGARVMVCGGRDMATGVSSTLTEIIAPLGLTAAMLKAEGRYVEDVY